MTKHPVDDPTTTRADQPDDTRKRTITVVAAVLALVVVAGMLHLLGVLPPG